MEKMFYKLSRRTKIKKKQNKNPLQIMFSRNLNHIINFDHTKAFEGKLHRKEIFKKKFSNKLLLVNMNWEKLGAVDIYSVLKSLIPNDGVLLSVSILSSTGLMRKKNLGIIPNLDIDFFDEGKLLFPKNVTYKKKEDITFEKKKEETFALVVCDSLKTSKRIFKTCNIIQIYGINDLISARFIDNFSLANFKKIDHADMTPSNYFPKFLNKPDTKSFFSKGVYSFNSLHKPREISPHIENFSKNNQDYQNQKNFLNEKKITRNKLNHLSPVQDPIFKKKYLNAFGKVIGTFLNSPEINFLKKEIVTQKVAKRNKKNINDFFFNKQLSFF